MKDRYMFPAVFETTDNSIGVYFPDLPGCVTVGENEIEAVRMAKEALALHLYGMEEDGDKIPTPSSIRDIQEDLESNEYVVMIEVWMPPFRHKMHQKAVKKTLTIPKWLDDIAKEHNVNYSHILQDALKKYLDIKERP
jgi:predicted RNase H-like HicB family nuclease